MDTVLERKPEPKLEGSKPVPAPQPTARPGAGMKLAFVTRFNCEPGPLGLDPQWMRVRAAILTNYGAESLQRQVDPFEWFVLVHPQTPPELVEELRRLRDVQVVLTDTPTVTTERLAAEMFANTPLALTRLDSDDWLSEEFTQRVTAEAAKALAANTTKVAPIVRFIHGIEVVLRERVGRSVISQNPPVTTIVGETGKAIGSSIERLFNPDWDPLAVEARMVRTLEPQWAWARHKFQTGGAEPPETTTGWDKLPDFQRFFGFTLC